MLRISAIITIAFFLLFSCVNKQEDTSVQYVYTQAIKELKDKNYSQAIEYFKDIDNNHPFSKWAIKGQIMTAYAYYKEKSYEEVIYTVENFIQNNPSHKNIAYMQYLKSMSYYNRIPNIKRGQDNTQMASYNLRELIARFPNSAYAKDAKIKLFLVDEHLAGAQMSIGRYKIADKNYIGAIKNFSEVISKYRNTNQVPEAYYRLAEIYQKIGMEDQALKALLTLQDNYQDNEWSQHSLTDPSFPTK